jgi:hypothetical protein
MQEKTLSVISPETGVQFGLKIQLLEEIRIVSTLPANTQIRCSVPDCDRWCTTNSEGKVTDLGGTCARPDICNSYSKVK